MFLLDQVLGEPTTRDAVGAANKKLERKPRRWIAKQLRRCDGNPRLVPWDERPGHAAALARVLERAFQKHEEWANGLDWNTLFNAAMMIRVKAGGEALIGEPLDWSPMQIGDGWTTGTQGPMWDVYPTGSPANRWDIVVAGWDKPDWSHDNEKEALLIAEHIESWPPPELAI